MSIGEMKDLQLKMRNLHVSQTLGWVGAILSVIQKDKDGENTSQPAPAANTRSTRDTSPFLRNLLKQSYFVG
jgi:hypothetical protein